MDNLGIIIGLIAIAITLVVGFLGVIIMMLQLNNQVKSEVREQFKNLDHRIDKLENKIDYTNQRIDKVYDVIADLYRALIKKDAA